MAEPINWVRSFEVAARLGSLTLAASELGQTQAAVSQQIKAMETRLGVQLFQRHPRGVTLTDAGSTLYENIATGLDYIDNALAAHKGSDSTDLRLVCNTSLAVRWLLPRLSDFCEKYPEIGLHLRSVLWRTDAIGVQSDIEISLGASQGTGEATALTSGEWVGVTSPGDISPQDKRLAVVTGWEAQYSSLNYITEKGRAPINADSFHMALGFVESGVAVTVCPKTLVYDALNSGVLTETAPITSYQKVPYQFTVNGRPNASIVAFKEWLLGQDRNLG